MLLELLTDIIVFFNQLSYIIFFVLYTYIIWAKIDTLVKMF